MVKKLQRRHTKKTEKRLWLYGKHAVLAALANENRQKHQLFYAAKFPPEQADSLPKQQVSTQDLQKLLGGFALHQGLALQVDPLDSDDARTFVRSHEATHPLLLLDDLEDLQNIGAIIRTASLMGVAGIVAEEWRESGHLARAASGALETVSLLQCGNVPRFLDWMKQEDFWIVGLDAAGTPFTQLDIPKRHLLVVGREGKGLHHLVKEKCDFLGALAMRGKQDMGPESFNVSVSTALALSHLGSDD